MLTYRHALKALAQKKVLITVPASCMTVLHGVYPITPVKVHCINNPFAATGASSSGIVAGLRVTGKQNYKVVAFAGDGGTYDIGIQALSGALERGADFMYVCYDNEGYMNTGTQRSSASPAGMITTTTPVRTKLQQKKDMIRIVEAHNISYIATASPAYPLDLYDKFVVARDMYGPRYLEVHAPCPPGWGFSNKDMVKIGRMAVECGIHVLFEIKEGHLRLTSRSLRLGEKGTRKPIREYLSMQSRFRKITEPQIQELQELTNRRWESFLTRHDEQA